MSVLDEINQDSEAGELSPKTMRNIQAMANWMKFISIFLLVVFSLFAFWGIYGSLQTYRVSAGFGIAMPFSFWIGAMIRLLLLIAIIYIQVVLLQTALRFSAFVNNRDPSSFEQAMLLYQRYWMLVCISLIIGLFLGFLLFYFIFSPTTRW